MFHAEQQIVQAYEELGLTPEQISVELPASDGSPLDISAVKTCLLTHSPKFNADNKALIKKGEAPLFDDSDVQAAKMTMKSLMLGSEVDAVRFRAAKFIVDEVKGRNDISNVKDAGKGINIVLIHQQMARAREAKERSLNQPTVDVAITEVEPQPA